MQVLSSSNPSCSPHVRVKISKWDNIQDASSCHEFVQYWTSWTLVGSLSANDGCVMAINEWSEAVCISVSNVWAPSWCQESWCYEPILMLTRVTIKIRSEQLSYYDIFSLDSKYTKSALRRIQSERFVESKVSIIALFCCVSWCLVLVTCSHYWLAPYPPQVKREEVSQDAVWTMKRERRRGFAYTELCFTPFFWCLVANNPSYFTHGASDLEVVKIWVTSKLHRITHPRSHK